MIVGKESAGKTCLLRRLFNESISDVSSTDGVDIVVRRCKINIEDGKWTIGKEFDDKKERINRALSPNGKTKMMDKESANRTKSLNKPTQIGKKESNTLVKKAIDVNHAFPMDITADDLADNKDTQNMQVDQTKDSTINHLDKTPTHKKDRKTDTKLIQDKNEPSLLVMPKDLMANVFSKSTAKSPRNLYALCALWDFAGQKEFYATHQAFLTSSAVYLVVADMENDILSKQDQSQCSADFQHIGDYVEFWFDSIHCHRTTDEPASYGYFDPPILLVFTGKDKYNEADFKKRKKELNDQIDKVLGNQSKHHHLHNKFYLSNIMDTDEEFEKLRFAIYETAGTMNNWGKAFPLKWILLEHLIDINKKEGKKFINFTDMFKLAKHHDINLQKENELLLFLRFQHHEGNIIFFENIRDLIILNPQWLADAFRCLVSDRFDNSRLHHRDDWTLFTQQGNISKSLIAELLKSKDSQFSGQTNNLHKVMEKLDILVKTENSNYIMPSMMPSAKFEDVCKKFGIRTEKCKRTSWLCFKFEFLPPSFFNHLSAWFIRNYDPSKLFSGIALYRGICMFDIDGSGCKKILVTMSTDTIALQIVSFSEQEGFGSTCSDIYSEVTQLIEDIKERYRMKISLKLHFKCSDGHYYKDTFAYDKLTRDQECFCLQHKKSHRSEKIYSPWIKNEVKRIPNRAKISTKQEDHNPKNEPEKEEAFDKDQALVKANLPVSVNLRQQLILVLCSVTSTINTRGYRCDGISYNDNNLYVVIGYSIIHVMDLTGKVIRTIPLPSNDITDITVDRNRLVCIDHTSIYCCSLDGKLIWKFEKNEFQDLRCVTTDDEGNVFVTSYLTNSVLVISDDGKHHRELLTKSDGLNLSCGIYFDKQENILLVCNHYDGKVFLFDVKRKST